MSGRINIHDGELRAHAANLLEVGNDLHAASSTAAAIDLHDGAFGVMMAWLPGVINKVAPSNADAIGAGGDGVKRTSDAVNDLADDFHGSDHYVASALDKITG